MLTRSAKLRRYWKLAHRWIGLTLGSILILAAFTGTLMTVARPLDEWGHADLFRVAPQASAVSGLPEHRIEPGGDGREVLERVRWQLASEFGPGASFRLRPAQQPGDSLWARVSGPWGGMVYFHPRTAVELGRRGEHQGLVNLLFELHSTLLMGEAGRAILAVASLAYLCLLISGLMLWWPVRWRHAWSVKISAGFTRALFDLHRAGGALLGLLIAVSVVSGAYMAWQPLSAAVTVLSGKPAMSAPRLPAAPDASVAAVRAAPLDVHVMNARAAVPVGRVAFVQVSALSGQPVRVRLKLPDDPHPIGLTSVWLHPVTAQVLAVQRWDQLDLGARAYSVMYPLHTGELGGPLHTFASAILGIALMGFCVSGIWLWWHRRKA
jgi:uncharacterized iron-regulated membrane protein